jgi:hypothetical protein
MPKDPEDYEEEEEEEDEEDFEGGDDEGKSINLNSCIAFHKIFCIICHDLALSYQLCGDIG